MSNQKRSRPARLEAQKRSSRATNYVDDFIPHNVRGEPTASPTQCRKLLSAGWTTTDNVYWTDPSTKMLHSHPVALHLLKDAPVSGNALETAFPALKRGAKIKAVTKQPRKNKTK